MAMLNFKRVIEKKSDETFQSSFFSWLCHSLWCTDNGSAFLFRSIWPIRWLQGAPFPSGPVPTCRQNWDTNGLTNRLLGMVTDNFDDFDPSPHLDVGPWRSIRGHVHWCILHAQGIFWLRFFCWTTLFLAFWMGDSCGRWWTLASVERITVCCRSQVISLVWGCLAEKQAPNYCSTWGFPTRVQCIAVYPLKVWHWTVRTRSSHVNSWKGPGEGLPPLGREVPTKNNFKKTTSCDVEWLAVPEWHTSLKCPHDCWSP